VLTGGVLVYLACAWLRRRQWRRPRPSKGSRE
jgi:hypothetical protein